MPEPKPQWKLVTKFPVSIYRCGAHAGEQVRLLRELVIRDQRGKVTGKVHAPGEVWSVVRGSMEEPRVLWLREPDGGSHTWDDADSFWNWFARTGEGAANKPLQRTGRSRSRQRPIRKPAAAPARR
jgi:hypothetical protein